jgi:two-component system, NarL family, nitrate/nitrite response regulator NarL
MVANLILTDSHPIVLIGLENLFRQETDLNVVARCTNGYGALRAVRRHRPDLLILDFAIPGLDGLSLVRRMREERHLTRPILFTAEIEANDMSLAIQAGVYAVVLKGAAPALLVDCVRNVLRAESSVTPLAALPAATRLNSRQQGFGQGLNIFTPRQLEIVRMTARGLCNQDIGKRLSIGEATVKFHLHRIFAKLNLRSRHELTLYAHDNGLG